MRNPTTLASFTVALALPAVAAVQTNVVERSYDRFGRLVGLSVDGEQRAEIAYDGATGRIASMRVAGADDPFRWEYELGSDLKKSLRYPNGAKVTWEYEPQRDFVTLVSNDVYSAYRYEYDAAGRRVAKNGERYEYNERGELILATNAVMGTSFAYHYDDIGNRLWSHEFGTNCVYAANELNQYTNVVRGGVSERTAFDLDGNQTNVVTSTGEWAVEYNGENRPVRWTRTSDAATVLMAYDHMGRRVRKNVETFVYDGYLNVSKTVWDPTEPVATRPLVWRSEDGNAFYCHDANKNVSDMVDATSGKAAAHYYYSAFGRTFASAGPLARRNPFRFSSECADDETGLVYYNYRHYSPTTGRWSSRDPIEFMYEVLRSHDMPIKDIAPAEYHLSYTYLCNNPCAKMDMLGLIDYLCTCSLVPYPVGEAVSNKIDGQQCSQERMGALITVEIEGACITDLSWFDCYCANRRCNLKTKFACTSKAGVRVPVIYVWKVVSSDKSGCRGVR